MVVSKECYFHTMTELVRCGWNPPITRDVVEYAESFDEQMHKLMAATEHAGPVLVPYEGASSGLTLNRLGLNVKSTDITRARVQVGVDASLGQAELSEANKKLRESGFAPVKVRLTTDASASGVNAAAMVPPFSYPTVHDAIVLIRRGDWLGKGDVERYYMLFPLAEEARHWFGAKYKGSLFWFVTLFFGFAAGSYYASVWSAELRRWVLQRGVRCVHMRDDWCVSEATEEEARKAMSTIAAVFLLAGIYMAQAKYEFAQRLTYLGIMLDTVRMSMSFDHHQCSDSARVLRQAVSDIDEGRQLSVKEVSSIAGKLNWYGSVLQVGRLHDRAWWQYLSRVRVGRNSYVSPELKEDIRVDSEWWIAQLETWASGGLAGNEFPILSASELVSRDDAVEIIQSDASGPDGCGYMFGSLTCRDPEYVSRKWKSVEESEGHSTYQELVALLDRVRAKPASPTLVIWVSDSGSAVYSVNKGRASEMSTLKIVTEVLMECDVKGFQIVGLWVPRELNVFADHLSHLATCVNRDSVSGRVSEMGPQASAD